MNKDSLFSQTSMNVRRWAIVHTPFKRIFDILFSISILLLMSPLLILISLLVALSSRGPILYTQERIGRGGVTFKCFKFRSMYEDADKRLKDILLNDPSLQKEWLQTHKLKKDPRITLIGKFLRRTSLDELPQFWNVVLGDLSVVGPRPVVKEEILNHFGDKACTIFSVRPGITGLWQISGRSNTCYTKRIALDEAYVKERTVLQDMKIIALTIPKMISRNGAY